jgi:cytochrome P450
VISTIEPEIVKTILSTKFQDFHLGHRRREVLLPIFGHGIFSNDGPAWERSRAMVRPNFVRAQVADLDMFEAHMGHLIDAIPRDGSTVDLQPLFFDLTMDTATEFLFGKSTNTLRPGLETKSANEFVKAFIYVTEGMFKDSILGPVLTWTCSERKELPIRWTCGLYPGCQMAKERQGYAQLRR